MEDDDNADEVECIADDEDVDAFTDLEGADASDDEDVDD